MFLSLLQVKQVRKDKKEDMYIFCPSLQHLVQSWPKRKVLVRMDLYVCSNQEWNTLFDFATRRVKGQLMSIQICLAQVWDLCNNTKWQNALKLTKVCLFNCTFKCIVSISTIQVIILRLIAQFFYTNLHMLFCQFINWTNWVNSGEFMDNCFISCHDMAEMKKVYNDLLITNM